jgi:MFS superfamily sulfate permease-like transporter
MPETSLSVPFLQNWLPGVRLLRNYDLKNISADLRAGLSVAAVAIPIGIAYAGLAGAPPVVGIYSCVLAPLAYLPSTALAAILIASSISLFDLASLRRYYRVSRPEFRHALVAMLGVMTVGVLMGVLVAVGLAMLKLLMLASKPVEAALSRSQQ